MILYKHIIELDGLGSFFNQINYVTYGGHKQELSGKKIQKTEGGPFSWQKSLIIRYRLIKAFKSCNNFLSEKDQGMFFKHVEYYKHKVAIKCCARYLTGWLHYVFMLEELQEVSSGWMVCDPLM